MASYEINQPLRDIEEIEDAFRQKIGNKYQYIITRNSDSAKVSRFFNMNYESLLIKQNAYHGVVLQFQQKDGKQFISTTTVTPNAFLGSVLGRVGLLDILIARMLFGTQKQLVTDVNEVIVNSFPVTVLDTSLSGMLKTRSGKS